MSKADLIALRGEAHARIDALTERVAGVEEQLRELLAALREAMPPEPAPQPQPQAKRR